MVTANGNGDGKCCHMFFVFFCHSLPFLQWHLHFFRLLLCVFVCVHVLHQQRLFNVCYTRLPAPTPSQILRIEGCSAAHRVLVVCGCRAGQGRVRHAEVKFASFFKTFKNQFQHNTLDKYECKKAGTEHPSLSSSLALCPLENFGLICVARRRAVTECRLPSSADKGASLLSLAPAATLALLFTQFIKTAQNAVRKVRLTAAPHCGRAEGGEGREPV